jgi:type II secretory pathway component GspD/PulD (secretin)
MTYPNALDKEQYKEMKLLLEKESQDKNLEFATIALNHVEQNEFEKAIQAYDSNIKIIPNKNQNSITLLYPKKIKNQLFALIKDINKESKIISFQIKIFEVTNSENKEMNLATPPIHGGFSLKNNNSTIQVKPQESRDNIKISNNFGEAKLIAEPYLLIKNKQEGKIHVGDKIPYLKSRETTSTFTTTLEHLDTGINIAIQPTIIDSNSIHCQVAIHLNLVKVWKLIEETEYPVLSSRQFESIVTLKNNESTLIASFNDSVKKNNYSTFPILSKIPVINWLFKNQSNEKNDSQILIYLTAKIT